MEEVRLLLFSKNSPVEQNEQNPPHSQLDGVDHFTCSLENSNLVRWISDEFPV